MLKILKWVGATLLTALLALLVYVAVLPDQFSVTRSVSVKAPPEKIFPLISDLKNFNLWNPFLKLDPTSKIVYGDKASGVGASYAWDGSGQAGQGRMAITELSAPSQATFKLNFTKPMQAENQVVFALQPKGDTTAVSWTMSGAYPFVNRLFGTLFNMDKMVGGEFEKGLADLKLLAEK